MSAHPDSHVLGPIEFAVNVITTLTVLLLTLVIATTVFGSGDGLGFSADEVCTQAAVGVIPTDTRAHVLGLSGEGRAFTSEVTVCSTDPGIGLRLASGLPTAANVLLLITVLVLAHRLLRRVRCEGSFTEGNALRVTRMGLVVLLGTVIVAVVRAVANGVVLSDLVPAKNMLVGFNGGFHLPIATLLIGFALLTFGRVLQRGVAMQADIDATI